MTHNLKIERHFYDAVASWEKNFEVRFNDRGFQKGDILILKPWSSEHVCYIQPYEGIERIVTYVHSGLGLKEGFVVLGLDEIKIEDRL